MAKRNNDNLRIKRKYLVWLKDARGLSDATVAKAAASISTYEAVPRLARIFRGFHPERARAFKRHLTRYRTPRTVTSRSLQALINGILRDLTAFLNWLADQPGYKSKIQRADIAYLSRRSEVGDGTPDIVLEAASVAGTSSGSALSNARRHRAGTSRPRAGRVLVPDRVEGNGGHLVCLLVTSILNTDSSSSTVGTWTPSLARASRPRSSRSVDQLERIFREWVQELRDEHFFSSTDPLFPRTKVGSGPDRRFAALGIDRAPWSTASSAARIFKEAFRNAGLPPFSPHRVRDTLAELSREHCRTPEDYKAWSQNMGHEDVMTTFRSYGSVAPGRQVELMTRFRRRGALPLDEDDDLIDPYD
jgi:hypothetical protein